MTKEVERKWLLPSHFNMPLNIDERLNTCQFYIDNIRIRQIIKSATNDVNRSKYFITVKGDGTISRNEWEAEIPQWVYHQLFMTHATNPVIHKTIHKIFLANLILEIHVYFGKLKDLIILECEFIDEAQANNFKLPSEIREQVIREVTNDVRYQNINLAIRGLPTV